MNPRSVPAQYLAQERSQPVGLLVVEHPLWRSEFNDLPAVHEHHTIGDLAGKSPFHA